MKILLKLLGIIRITLIIILVIFIAGCKTLNNKSNKTPPKEIDSLKITQVVTDTLFESNQIISLVILNNSSFNNYAIDIGYEDYDLIKTSEIAKKNNAIAAVNGGFFDMTKGGSVSYLEVDGTVINKTHDTENKWAKPDKLINGVIIKTKNDKILIQSVEPEINYENSMDESFVLVTGPLLIKNSKSLKLPDMKFTHNRHPRTCMCTTKESVVLMTVDGRQEKAQGMNLMELQNYLHSIGCIDAINLDGGGSTTMWVKDKGIVNYPSDKKGERPVANAILILKGN